MITVLTTLNGLPGVAGAARNDNGTYRLDLVDGTSRQADAAEILNATKAVRVAAIKTARDRIKIEGVTVGENRFHSDPDSRTQQLGLVIMGASVPPVQWKTMGGSFVTMTQTLAGQIFQATAARDMAVFGHAETLIAAVNASDDPDSIDIEAGWPA